VRRPNFLPAISLSGIVIVGFRLEAALA
jgi:hypothetical protein